MKGRVQRYVLGGLAMLTWAACSSSSGDSRNNGFGPGGTGASGGADPDSGMGAGNGTGGSGATGAVSGTGGGGGLIGTGGSGAGPMGDAGMLPDGACGALTLEGERVTETRTETRIEKRTETHIETMIETRTEPKPIAIYFMLDQSGSMAGPKWAGVQQNLSAFVVDPSSTNLDVALQYFPIGFDACNVGQYAVPEVPLGRLLAWAPQIQTSLNNHAISLGFSTPISAALEGATQFCMGFKTLPNRMPPDEDCVVVYITDGEPSQCNQDFNAIAQIAGNAWNQSQVRTYPIGMAGANFTLLNDIATRGNGDCNPNVPGAQACDISTDPNGLSAALSLIRDTITTTTTVDVPVDVEVEVEVEVPVDVEVTVPLDCEWVLPTSSSTDPDKVNVDYTDLGTGDKTGLGKVDSEAECSNFQNGWYYDDPTNPTKILACPDVCDTIKTTDAKIDILVGCETIVAPPR